jgi:hypothetical protein
MKLAGNIFGMSVLLLACALAAAAQDKPENAAAPAAPLVLSDGTPVKLKLGRDLSSATEKIDALVDFEVLEEVKVNDVVVIERGGLALGRVTLAQPRRRMGRTGKLEITIEKVQLADGQKAPMRASQTAPEGSRVGRVAMATAAAGVLFFPAAPFFLLIKGRDLVIPKGTLVTAYLNGDQQLDPARFAPTEKK